MAKILFFGRLSELSRPLDIDLPAGIETTDALKLWLSQTYPNLKTALAQSGIRVAVNKHMATTIMPIANADEIAFMSPLSGG